MTGNFVQMIMIAAGCLIAWFVVERFSPDPLVTKICQVIIFLVAIWKIVLPLLGLA